MKRKIVVTAKFFEQMFRKGFKAELVNNEVDENLDLTNYGYDINNDTFYFIFSNNGVEVERVEDLRTPVFRRLE